MELSLELLNDFSIGVGGYSTTLGSKSYVALTTVTSSRIAYPGVTGEISITSGTGEYRINGGSWVSAQPELVTNGTFDTDITSWTEIDASSAVSAGIVTITNLADNGKLRQSIPLVIGQTYEIKALGNNGTGAMRAYYGSSYISLAGTENSAIFTATATSINIDLLVVGAINDTGTVNYVSVQRILATTDYIEARMTSSGSYSTALELVFALDTGTDTFTVTTEASVVEYLTDVAGNPITDVAGDSITVIP